MRTDDIASESTESPEPREPDTDSSLAKEATSRRRFLQAAGGAGVVGLVGMPGAAAGKQHHQHKNHTLTLVASGESQGVILHWSSDDEPVAGFAASELQDYITEMSGVTVPVREVAVTAPGHVENAASGLVVLTGGEANRYLHGHDHGHQGKDKGKGRGHAKLPDGWVKSVDDALAGKKPDSFAVRTDGQRMTLAGSTHRGTLYSAYEFLERQGIRFFAPDFAFYEDNAEQVPSKSTVTTDSLNFVEEPDLEYRREFVEEGWSFNARDLTHLLDWMAKNKRNILNYPYDYKDRGTTRYDMSREQILPELEKRGLSVEVGGHGFQSWLPPNKYPEYYTSGKPVFDVTNPDAIQQYTDEVISYLKDRPEIDIFDAWPPDGGDIWPEEAIEKFGSVPNAEAYVIRQLTNAVEKQLSGVKVEEIAYHDSIAPPDQKYMYDSNRNIIDYAPIGRSYKVPIYDHSASRNAHYDKYLKQWLNSFDGPLAIYEYYRKYRFHSLPVILTNTIGKDITYEYDLESGIDGLGIYAEPADWITYEFTHRLVAKISWDTTLDAEDYLSKYLTNRYGDTTSEMQTYFNLVEDAGETLYDPNSRGDLNAVSKARQDYIQAKQALETASNNTSTDSTAAFLIQRLIWNTNYSIADTNISYYGLNDQSDKVAKAKQHAHEIILSHRFDGVILQHTRTANRTDLSKYSQSDFYEEYDLPALGFAQPDSPITVGTGKKAQIKVEAQSVDYQSHTVSWSASTPDGISLSSSSGSIEVSGSNTSTQGVTLSASKNSSGGSYDIDFQFKDENGTKLLDDTINVLLPGNLASFFNNIGITNADNKKAGNFDNFTCTYPATALENANIVPGGQVSYNGVTFTWPDVAPGTADNVIAKGQIIAESSFSSGSNLAFLGAGAPGNAKGTGTIIYNDGTKQRYTLGFRDWQQKDDNPPVNDEVAVKLPYRNCVKHGSNHPTYIFYADVNIEPSKNIDYITLPANTNRPLHIFAIEVS